MGRLGWAALSLVVLAISVGVNDPSFRNVWTVLASGALGIVAGTIIGTKVMR